MSNQTPFLLELTTNLSGAKKQSWCEQELVNLVHTPPTYWLAIDFLQIKNEAGDKSPQYADRLREWLAATKIKTAAAKVQVCVIHNLYTVQSSALPTLQNLLLKTLEEPPANSLFILTCDNLGQVLSTVQSRCRVKTVVNYQIDENTVARVSQWWGLENISVKTYHELIKLTADLIKQQTALAGKEVETSDLAAARSLVLDLIYTTHHLGQYLASEAALKCYRLLGSNVNAKLAVEELLFTLKAQAKF